MGRGHDDDGEGTWGGDMGRGHHDDGEGTMMMMGRGHDDDGEGGCIGCTWTPNVCAWALINIGLGTN